MSENILQIGLCLPKSCTNGDIKQLAQQFFNGKSQILRPYQLNARVLEVKNLKFSPRFFLNKSFLLLTIASALIIWLTRLAKNLDNTKDTNNNNNNVNDINGIKAELSLRKKIVKCFNYDENKKSILSRDVSKSTLKSISGLR